MKRGDFVTVALPGDLGKPGPALIIEADLFNETHASITVLPVTSAVIEAALFRVEVAPTPANG